MAGVLLKTGLDCRPILQRFLPSVLLLKRIHGRDTGCLDLTLNKFLKLRGLPLLLNLGHVDRSFCCGLSDDLICDALRICVEAVFQIVV